MSHDIEPPSWLPSGAVLHVLESYPNGQPSQGDYRLGERLVANVLWNGTGRLDLVQFYDPEGCRHGIEREFFDSLFVGIDFDRPRLKWATSHVHGVMHGLSLLLDLDGVPIVATVAEHGRGYDLWGDRELGVQEYRELSSKGLHGLVRWGDPTEPFEEEHHHHGQRHGVFRRWVEGELADGYPVFFVNDEPVSAEAYAAACADDPTLPSYRAEEDAPERPPHPVVLDALARAAEMASTFDAEAWLAADDARLAALWATVEG